MSSDLEEALYQLRPRPSSPYTRYMLERAPPLTRRQVLQRQLREAYRTGRFEDARIVSIGLRCIDSTGASGVARYTMPELLLHRPRNDRSIRYETLDQPRASGIARHRSASLPTILLPLSDAVAGMDPYVTPDASEVIPKFSLRLPPHLNRLQSSLHPQRISPPETSFLGSQQRGLGRPRLLTPENIEARRQALLRTATRDGLYLF